MGQTVNTDGIHQRLGLHCMEHGLQFSEKKKEVIDVLASLDRYINAEGLWLLILSRQKVKVSHGMVYLILNWLVSTGYVEKRPSGLKYYEFKMNHRNENH